MNLAHQEVAINMAARQYESFPNDNLIFAAKSGSPAAFAGLWDIHSQKIYRRLLTITKNREDAQDALQDAFLHAYKALHTFEGRSSFNTWLTRIAINSALMILRKRRIRPEVSFDVENEMGEQISVFEVKDNGPSPEHICDQHQQCARVLELIGKLRPCLRQVVEMRLTQSYSIKEIAHALAISEAAVKSRLSRARARLTGVDRC
jgi:RNA polymerase sigma-70 factor (ECF subfamily)